MYAVLDESTFDDAVAAAVDEYLQGILNGVCIDYRAFSYEKIITMLYGIVIVGS